MHVPERVHVRAARGAPASATPATAIATAATFIARIATSVAAFAAVEPRGVRVALRLPRILLLRCYYYYNTDERWNEN